jgi:nucleoid-associated protein YejK
MPPSLVPTKQIKNHQIRKEDEKKMIYKTKESKKSKTKKTKNLELKLKSHLGLKLEFGVFLHNPRM